MSAYKEILLPLDGSVEAAKAAGVASWLAERLGATLHVLHSTEQPMPAREALERLRVPGAGGAQAVLHQLSGDPHSAVLKEIDEHGIDLLVMSAAGESAASGAQLPHRLGAVARAVMERCRVPVLLLPARYREALPWQTMLVAASGERAADQALEAALRLAIALELEVTVAHCEDGPSGTAPLGEYADAPHYEVAGRLDELVSRATARRTREQCRVVREAMVCRGEPAQALLEAAARRKAGVLALGWHGALDEGRALVLKRMLEEAHLPLLLVRLAEKPAVRLKVGEAIEGG